MGALYKHFRAPDQAPLAFIRRDDGTITGDVVDMDSLIRAAWGPIFAKHDQPGDPGPPPVQPFLDVFGKHIPVWPLSSKPLIVPDLAKGHFESDFLWCGGIGRVDPFRAEDADHRHI